ncbi:sulfur carrier protein ThiS [Tenacibaculum maritimum]|uniref:sulfur carrier protein ThiS n=1 Tax=Tenacibaculum maritimum TaxID=107401 RepID=UPI00040B7E85|nr:sulfur carrier protein ThiS [Tenacibaculum maritimum]MCD9561693.1 sulfur carrier protein ThiS [Tenacibaculum maritimum]MCD9564700.1 sulfur carrier protein ThiS [Tenacibaculum maritimum]MCD9577829.1 sulfur carrier protein ThiS [Tenacibaculum maritimum]MCD9585638.1 sulfur carrier protein ThiS [Tenacibaculum maritimum]MCD9597582.1 sulfur carrier protein ThiS [Tenacibaculum maritimum]
MITIKVNQKEYQISENLTLETFVKDLKIESSGIAIAVNNVIITKKNWSLQLLQSNDDILIISATQGG